MKNIFILFILSFFLFAACHRVKTIEYDFTDITSYENFLMKYPQMGEIMYHKSWVFEPGEYYLLSNTNIYEYPHINSRSIGYLFIHDKINIIEDAHYQHNINDVVSCWYKINHKNTDGYIFGGNIAIDTFICDMDNNGINDIFQYRISEVDANWHINSIKDIIIYINGNRISTDSLNAGINENGFLLRFFNFCRFEQKNGEVNIILTNAGPENMEEYIFSVNVSGNITLTNIHKEGRFFEKEEWMEYEGEH
ncbi:MAG: hypothetical protein FWC01_07180 [Treponema sp.]|nr:hypothetical protein [Treponema sp.]MCL2237639.1 hypothetical protein [Treponema sp.]